MRVSECRSQCRLVAVPDPAPPSERCGRGLPVRKLRVELTRRMPSHSLQEAGSIRQPCSLNRHVAGIGSPHSSVKITSRSFSAGVGNVSRAG